MVLVHIEMCFFGEMIRPQDEFWPRPDLTPEIPKKKVSLYEVYVRAIVRVRVCVCRFYKHTCLRGNA